MREGAHSVISRIRIGALAMPFYKKLLLLAALIVMSLTSATSALAATATITGGPTVNGTASTSTLFKNHTAGKTYSCTGSALNGTVSPSSSGSIPPGFRTGTLTPSFTGCNIVGGLGITIVCQNDGWVITGLTVAGNTPGAITGISCHLFVTAQTACRKHVVGSVGATFSNAAHSLIIDVNHQNLSRINSTNGMGGTCSVLPNDPSARWVSPLNADLVFNVSPTNLTVNVS
jgi:hypothetical protein